MESPTCNPRLAAAADSCIALLDAPPHPSYSPEGWRLILECCVSHRASLALWGGQKIGGPDDTALRFKAVRVALERERYIGPKPLADLIADRRRELALPPEPVAG